MMWRRVVMSASALLGGVLVGAAAAPSEAKRFCEFDICLNPNVCVNQTIIRTGCDMQGVFCATYQCEEK
jgi:hypothetical protein